MLSLLLTPLLAACSADSTISTAETEATPEPVVFAMTFGKNTSITRATTLDNLWPANTVVSISNGTKIDYTTGTTPSTSASIATKLTPAGANAFYWPSSDPVWKFSAWYPAGDSPAMSATVVADQGNLEETPYQAYDLLYCPPTSVTFRQKPIELTFLHQLARVVVIVNSTYTERKEQVTEVKFGNGNIALSRNIDALPNNHANGQTTWKDGTQNSTIIMRANATMTDTDNHVYTFECMVPPQTSTGTVENLVQITTSGSEDGNRTYNYSDAFDLKSGYQYTYTILISERGAITLATVKVTDWTTGAPVENTALYPDISYPDTPIN